ncbi:MAG TPA: hypothetical protein VK027_09505 [Chitinophagaceae bacterium]|nr:hypothetical protein [Chitinophagaceae bacterium]
MTRIKFMLNFLIFSILIGAPLAQAQVQIGSSKIPVMNKAGDISEEQYRDFLNATTVFAFQFKQYEAIKEYEQVLKEVWDVTPFKIVNPDDLGNYFEYGYNIYMFGGWGNIREGKNSVSVTMHFSYDLSTISQKGKSKLISKLLVFPDEKSLAEAKISQLIYRGSSKVFSEKVTEYMYNDADIYFMEPGYFKGYIKFINNNLKNLNRRGIYSKDGPYNLKSLQTDTLFIAEETFYYPLFDKEKFTFSFNPDYYSLPKKINKEIWTLEEIKKVYPYPVKILSAKEISDKILAGDKGKYLAYIKSPGDRFIGIFNMEDSEVVWMTGLRKANRFLPKDFKYITKIIKKES